MRAPEVQLRIPSRGSNSVGLPHRGFYPRRWGLGGGAWVGQGPGQWDLGGSQQGRQVEERQWRGVGMRRGSQDSLSPERGPPPSLRPPKQPPYHVF